MPINKDRLYKDIGVRIRFKRLELEWTQTYLAERLGISPSYLSHVEAGNRRLTLDVLVDIADCMNISLEYLLIGNNAISNHSRSVLGKDLLKRLEIIFQSPKGDQLRKVVNVLVDNYKNL